MMPRAETLALARDLDEDTRRLVREMATCNDDYRPFVRTLAADADLPVERARQILRTLGAQGLATYGPVRDEDDGRPMGSTWWLTERGAALQQVLGK